MVKNGIGFTIFALIQPLFLINDAKLGVWRSEKLKLNFRIHHFPLFTNGFEVYLVALKHRVREKMFQKSKSQLFLLLYFPYLVDASTTNTTSTTTPSTITPYFNNGLPRITAT